jgi:hypothetical protein
MGPRNAEPVADFSMKDLEEDIQERLWSLYEDYWNPVAEWADGIQRELERDSDLISKIQSPDLDYQELVVTNFKRLGQIDPQIVDQWLDQYVVLPPKYAARRRLIVTHLSIVVHDSLLKQHGGITTSRYFAAAAFEWVGVAMASGVAGNVAYAVLGRLWRRGGRILRRNRNEVEDRVSPDQAISYLVKLAVREQCQRHLLPVPVFSDLQIRQWESHAQTAVATIVADTPRMVATVEVPYSDIEQLGVRVTIRQAGGPR